MRFAFNLSCRFPALPAPYREFCNSTRLGSLNQRTFLPRADTPTEAVVLFGLNWRTNEESMLIYFIETESIKKYIERLPYWESVSNTVVVEEMTRTIGNKNYSPEAACLHLPPSKVRRGWCDWILALPFQTKSSYSSDWEQLHSENYHESNLYRHASQRRNSE